MLGGAIGELAVSEVSDPIPNLAIPLPPLLQPIHRLPLEQIREQRRGRTRWSVGVQIQTPRHERLDDRTVVEMHRGLNVTEQVTFCSVVRVRQDASG